MNRIVVYIALGVVLICETIIVGVLVGRSAAATTLTPGGCEVVRPFLVDDCRKCVKIKTIDTGNSTSGGGKIVSERVRCRGCKIEFRVDLECVPTVAPCPYPVERG
jgi:hypothetical protein